MNFNDLLYLLSFLFYFYGIQLVRQLFYLNDKHFQVKTILMYIFMMIHMLKV